MNLVKFWSVEREIRGYFLLGNSDRRVKFKCYLTLEQRYVCGEKLENTSYFKRLRQQIVHSIVSNPCMAAIIHIWYNRKLVKIMYGGIRYFLVQSNKPIIYSLSFGNKLNIKFLLLFWSELETQDTVKSMKSHCNWNNLS